MNVEFKIFNCHMQPSSETHHLEPMNRLYGFAHNQLIVENKFKEISVIDPFARRCLWGTKRNDLNPKFLGEYTTHCMDALDFLNSVATGEAHMAILDPPFSGRQCEEEYGSPDLYRNPKYMVDLGKEIFRILKPGGYVLKCGYNSNRPFKGFTLVKLYIANYPPTKNDILFSLWKKNQTTLTKIIGLA